MEKAIYSNIKHIAFIMDGNGRWAKARALPRYKGHKKGVERITEIYDECFKLGISVVSFYCFSSENWNRPQDEIDHLFAYLKVFFQKNIKRFIRDGIKIIISGDITRLPLDTQEVINEAIFKTKDFTKFTFNVCLNYGSQQEIVRAAQSFAKDVLQNKIKVEELNIHNFNSYLYTAGLPDVDLLIRTSGEQRVSNFLLYQLSYAEFIFDEIYWPDFDIKRLYIDLDIFMTRKRRFGGIENE
ncbi:MAG: polyprenyl diphosphate synthase [Bacilli bacterium]